MSQGIVEQDTSFPTGDMISTRDEFVDSRFCDINVIAA